jgi:hypothetical protein
MLATLISTRLVWADDSVTWSGEIDGVPAWITVVARGHNISVRKDEPWWQWGNTTTDAYLFAFEQPDNVRLILSFEQRANGLPEARLFTNKLGQLPLDFTLEGDNLTIHTNDGNPDFLLRPLEGGWLIDGQANYNLELLLDGLNGNAIVDPDGEPDWEVRVGAERPGIPGWETERMLTDPHPAWGYRRYIAEQRLPDAAPFKVAPPIMPTFPYLGIGLETRSWFVENPNPLFFNLGASVLRRFAFAGFQTAGMYRAYSITTPPELNFENPYVFYNFDQSNRRAELVIRGNYFPEGDPFGPPPSSLQRTAFRYSWKTGSARQWSYAIHVAGFHPFTELVQIGQDEILSVPAGQLPSWVVDKTWPAITFVEATQGYPGSEGIYFYSAASDEIWSWLSGRLEEPPPFLNSPYYAPDVEGSTTNPKDRTLPVGFRGEYSSAYFHQPSLYLSPIDYRLHLLHAMGGTWYLDSKSLLRTHNLDGDTFIDGWTLETNIETEALEVPHTARRVVTSLVEEELYDLDGLLVYAGKEEVELRRAEYQPALLEIAPPTDRTSWAAFKQQAQTFKAQERDPSSLQTWLQAFAGESLIISGGSIAEVRTAGEGFRFILELNQGFQIEGDDFLGIRQRDPGRYVVSYDGSLRVAPVSVPEIDLALSLPGGNGLNANEQITIKIGITNSGRDDVSDANLITEFHLDGRLVDSKIIETKALSGDSSQILIDWYPPKSGLWEVRTRLESENETLAVHGVQFTISDGPPTGSAIHTLLGTTGQGWRLLASLSILLMILFLALVLARSSIYGFPAAGLDDTEGGNNRSRRTG